MRVCAEPGCPEIQPSRYCPTHTRGLEQRRGTKQERGYDKHHDRARADMAKTVIGTPCARCGLMILPGQPWHADHTDDRTGYIGPSHAWCNESAGGRAAHGLPPQTPGG